MVLNKDLSIKTRLEDLNQVEEAIEGFAESMEWSMKFTNQVQLVLEELIVNVINYGHDSPSSADHEVHIYMNANQEQLVLEIEDDGRPFDPLHDGPDVDTKSGIDQRKIGGLGIHLVRKLTHKISYKREDGMNKLTIVKLVEQDES